MKYIKKVLKTAFYFAAPAVLFVNLSLSAFAGSFTHVHSSACYGTVQATCNHYYYYGKEYSWGYCPGCGRENQIRMDTCMEMCVQTGNSTYRGAKTSCDGCGYVFEDGIPNESPGSHTYGVTRLTCGMSEGASAATVSVSGGDGGWTNSPVSVSCNVSVSDPTFSVSDISFSGGGGSTGTVSQNGTYSFTVTGSNGQSVTESVTVSNIDMTAPSVSLSKSPDSWTEEGVTISASTSDDLSGIAGISFNGGGYSSESSWTVTSNGTYSVSVRDNAGNESSASITVSNIGKDPVIEEQKRQEEERRKREEEERRKKEEESRKREEEAKNAQNGSGGSGSSYGQEKDTSISNDKAGSSKAKDSNKGILSFFTDKSKDYPTDPVTNDVSDNDVSANDASGNDVPVKVIKYAEPTQKPEATLVSNGLSTDPKISADAGSVSLLARLKNNGTKLLGAGVLLIAAALGLLLTFSWVYEKDEKKTRPVSTVRIKEEKDMLIADISGKRIKPGSRYGIFLSPFITLSKKKKPLKIKIDGEPVSDVSEDGKTFIRAC